MNKLIHSEACTVRVVSNSMRCLCGKDQNGGGNRSVSRIERGCVSRGRIQWSDRTNFSNGTHRLESKNKLAGLQTKKQSRKNHCENDRIVNRQSSRRPSQPIRDIRIGFRFRCFRCVLLMQKDFPASKRGWTYRGLPGLAISHPCGRRRRGFLPESDLET